MRLTLLDVFRHGIRGAFDLSCYGGVCTKLIIQDDHFLNLFRRNSPRAHKITLLRVGLAGTLHGYVTFALQILVGINGNFHGKSSFFCAAICCRCCNYIVGGSAAKVTIHLPIS